jgi:hypothetical protein
VRTVAIVVTSAKPETAIVPAKTANAKGVARRMPVAVKTAVDVATVARAEPVIAKIASAMIVARRTLLVAVWTVADAATVAKTVFVIAKTANVAAVVANNVPERSVYMNKSEHDTLASVLYDTHLRFRALIFFMLLFFDHRIPTTENFACGSTYY